MRILGNFEPTCEYKKSRNLATDGPIFANLYQKMRKTWKKKVMKRRVAISGGRDTVADFVQGGVKLTPPPVKIGLIKTHSEFS